MSLFGKIYALYTHPIFRSYIFPLFLLCVMPFLVCCWHLIPKFFDGSFIKFIQEFNVNVVFEKSYIFPSNNLIFYIFGYIAFQYFLIIALPAKWYSGPPSPEGNVPLYPLNGVGAFLITTVGCSVGHLLGFWDMGQIYDHYQQILVFCNVSAFIFCFFLYFKGIYFPSTSDCNYSGNFIWDFFWGIELYPTIFGVSMKQLINCRSAMMGWAVVVLSCVFKQYSMEGGLQDSMIVSASLQLIYIFKFFYWEGGYFRSIDIMHDRFGFYICWGVCSYLPALYTSTSQYLVNHPVELGMPLSIFIFSFGVSMIWLNFDADNQRQSTRDFQGNYVIWGKKAETIVARYETGDGKKRENLLLVSGWWGISRHFNYLPELALAFSFGWPAGFTHLYPHFYVVFLTILLVDRSYRDEIRCSEKYGVDWKKYSERVPWSMIPGIY